MHFWCQHSQHPLTDFLLLTFGIYYYGLVFVPLWSLSLFSDDIIAPNLVPMNRPLFNSKVTKHIWRTVLCKHFCCCFVLFLFVFMVEQTTWILGSVETMIRCLWLTLEVIRGLHGYSLRTSHVIHSIIVVFNYLGRYILFHTLLARLRVTTSEHSGKADSHELEIADCHFSLFKLSDFLS